MSAPILMILFDAIYLISLTAWVGSVLFVSLGIAPIIFPTLGPEAGAKFVRGAFLRYYQWGAIAGAIGLPSAVAVPLAFPELRGPMVGVQALVILAATLLMLYAGNVLAPAIEAVRDEGPSGNDRFERLHRRSVRLNFLVMVLGLGLLVAFAARPKPLTRGIVELSPTECAERQLKKLRELQQTSPPPAQPLP